MNWCLNNREKSVIIFRDMKKNILHECICKAENKFLKLVVYIKKNKAKDCQRDRNKSITIILLYLIKS